MQTKLNFFSADERDIGQLLLEELRISLSHCQLQRKLIREWSIWLRESKKCQVFLQCLTDYCWLSHPGFCPRKDNLGKVSLFRRFAQLSHGGSRGCSRGGSSGSHDNAAGPPTADLNQWWQTWYHRRLWVLQHRKVFLLIENVFLNFRYFSDWTIILHGPSWFSIKKEA